MGLIHLNTGLYGLARRERASILITTRYFMYRGRPARVEKLEKLRVRACMRAAHAPYLTYYIRDPSLSQSGFH